MHPMYAVSRYTGHVLYATFVVYNGHNVTNVDKVRYLHLVSNVTYHCIHRIRCERCIPGKHVYIICNVSIAHIASFILQSIT